MEIKGFCELTLFVETLSVILTRSYYRNNDDPLQEMSVRAVEQMICIMGVCMLCSGLYFIMVWLEKLCTRIFFPEEDNPEHK